jgi:hypothetical protein
VNAFWNMASHSMICHLIGHCFSLLFKKPVIDLIAFNTIQCRKNPITQMDEFTPFRFCTNNFDIVSGDRNMS